MQRDESAGLLRIAIATPTLLRPAFNWSWTYYGITYNGLKIGIYGGWPSSCCLSQPNKMRSIYIKDTSTLRNVIAASTSGLCLGGSNASNVTVRVAGTALLASGSGSGSGFGTTLTTGSGSDSTNVFDTAVLSAMLTTNGWQADGSVNTSWTGSPVYKYYSDLGVSLRRGANRAINRASNDTVHTYTTFGDLFVELYHDKYISLNELNEIVPILY